MKYVYKDISLWTMFSLDGSKHMQGLRNTRTRYWLISRLE